MNAVVHNDYSSQAPIQIKVFSDRLTVYNSGGLPLGWTLDKLLGSHRSVPRNPSMANVFFRAGLIESFGRGIDMIMSQFNGRDVLAPVFETGIDEFSVTFSNEMGSQGGCRSEDADQRLRKVLTFLSTCNGVTYRQISEGTGFSVRQIQRLVGGSIDDGSISKSKVGREVHLSLRPRSSRPYGRAMSSASLSYMSHICRPSGMYGISVRTSALLVFQEGVYQ